MIRARTYSNSRVVGLEINLPDPLPLPDEVTVNGRLYLPVPLIEVREPRTGDMADIVAASRDMLARFGR